MAYAVEAKAERDSMDRRALKRSGLRDLLRSGDIERAAAELGQLPGRRFLNPLRSALCSDERAKWSAVTLIGLLTAELADRDPESARVVMRTLMWNLTEESGGIAWGVPESLAEIMACHEALAEEYAPILVSYMREDGNFLEYEPLQRGVVWGVGRLAQVRPGLLRDNHASRYLLPYLESADAVVRGLAAWALGLIGTREAATSLEALVEDREEVRLYLDRELVTTSVGELARRALVRTAGR
jgi:HEAT repeat protein